MIGGLRMYSANVSNPLKYTVGFQPDTSYQWPNYILTLTRPPVK